MEEWRNVNGYEGLYEVSSAGRVKSLPRLVVSYGSRSYWTRTRILRPANVCGYLVVVLSRDGVTSMEKVHRLVGYAFLGLTKTGVINHLDGVKQHNDVGNLEVTDSAGNLRHADEAGLWNIRGERNHHAKLTVADVVAIRQRLANGEPGRTIARDYPVHRDYISLIKNRTIWKHVG